MKVSPMLWSAIGKIVQQLIFVALNIFTARLLGPEEYGTVGVLTIFVVVSNLLVESGFKDAIIREKEHNESTFSSVFFFNVLLACTLYVLLFILAGCISRYFGNPDLIAYARVLFLVFIFNSLSVVHGAILVRRLAFKSIALANVSSSIVAGTVSLLAAYYGCGVWSLVIGQVLRPLIRSLVIIVESKWRPHIVFSINKLSGLFSFGINILVCGLLGQVCANLVRVFLGRYFSLDAVGLYDRASNLQRLVSSTLSDIINEVSYPVIVRSEQKRNDFHGFVNVAVFCAVPIFVYLFTVSEQLIVFLLTDKWRGVVVLFKILCVSGIFYPLATLNNVFLKVNGRSDWFLRNEVIRNVCLLLGFYFARDLSIVSLVLVSAGVNALSTLLNISSVVKLLGTKTLLYQLKQLLLAVGFAIVSIYWIYQYLHIDQVLLYLMSSFGLFLLGYLFCLFLFSRTTLMEIVSLVKGSR